MVEKDFELKLSQINNLYKFKLCVHEMEGLEVSNLALGLFLYVISVKLSISNFFKKLQT